MKLLTARDVYHLEKKIEAGQMSKDDILELLEYAQDTTVKLIHTIEMLQKTKNIVEQQIKSIEI